MSQECGNGNFNTSCNGDNQFEVEGSNNSTSAEAEMLLKLPVGTQFYNEENQLVYTIPTNAAGEPDKCKIKIPAATA
ncbi:hypothetical protein Oweho_3223 [Owenweeksia hongkongensis DSM 17368]|uniref:Uncharacterized protein n=1 Tax=Owenweeksia hongkongensis (strain DSM 17368 / CIP 108786 / JCM 12287 / NRRL B-23963 / UST20020801) TaxID=926562 RepID=G8R3T7_OWEHD|nr:hypothetical protein [Owenweeksia hongkongensis]AEV34174.1 hypothetical protein Oweho_3223 [Owenweeksia hongkongensis DSM 17368]